MKRLVDLNFHHYAHLSSLHQIIERLHSWYGYAEYMPDQVELMVVCHSNKEEFYKKKNITYRSFKGKNTFFYPFKKTIACVRAFNPDAVLIHGLIYPFQIFLLKLLVPNVKLLVVPHGESVEPVYVKRLFLKIADNFVYKYLCTSGDTLNDWVDNSLITGSKRHETICGSTALRKTDRVQSQRKTGVVGLNNFLWVGRLNENKDPLTIVGAFKMFSRNHPDARLWIIYQTDELLNAVKRLIHEYNLNNIVTLVGKVNHQDLQYWYSVCDFFVLGSHKEAAGYALMEAMACGCIPIVTDIPSFRTLTGNGKYGFLFTSGKVEELVEALEKSQKINRVNLSTAVAQHFEKAQSFKAMAGSIDRLF